MNVAGFDVTATITLLTEDASFGLVAHWAVGYRRDR